MRARGPGRQVHGSRRERPVAGGESGMVAGGKGGQVGACQSGLDKGVGGEVFPGEDLEPVSEVKRQIPYHPEPQLVFGVRPAGVYEKACGQGSCIRGGALSGSAGTNLPGAIYLVHEGCAGPDQYHRRRYLGEHPEDGRHSGAGYRFRR